MKIAIINGSDFGSTGKIAIDIMDYVESQSNICCTLFTSNKKTKKENVICIDDNKLIKNINRIIVKIFGSDGFRSIFNTKKLIKKLKKEKFDLIHIHTLHGYYINLPLLFRHIKKEQIPVILTLHDNWIFSGRCACIPETCKMFNKECLKCEYKSIYPRTFFDCAHHYFRKKHRIINGLDNIVFISPSKWNLNYREATTLNEKKMIVINNGIDLSIFHPTKSDLKEKHNICNKFIILCVAYPWSNAKGLNYINKLASEIDPNIFTIVMIGIEDNIETHESIIRIPPIYDQNELAKYYSMSDVFLSPTQADNYPTVAMEAISCGCPVVFFDVGGTSEIVTKDVGILIEKNDYDAMKNAIIDLYNHPIKREDCIKNAYRFDKTNMLKQYLKLYTSMMEEK